MANLPGAKHLGKFSAIFERSDCSFLVLSYPGPTGKIFGFVLGLVTLSVHAETDECMWSEKEQLGDWQDSS